MAGFLISVRPTRTRMTKRFRCLSGNGSELILGDAVSSEPVISVALSLAGRELLRWVVLTPEQAREAAQELVRLADEADDTGIAAHLSSDGLCAARKGGTTKITKHFQCLSGDETSLVLSEPLLFDDTVNVLISHPSDSPHWVMLTPADAREAAEELARLADMAEGEK